MSASIEHIWSILASRPKFIFSPTFIFCSPICPYNCGVVSLWKNILVFEKWFFFVRPLKSVNFSVNITRVVWPRVTNLLDLEYFCQHSPLFYYLPNLLLLLKLARKYLFFVEYFCPTYFFFVEKWHENKDTFNNDRDDRIYCTSSF